MNSVENNTKNNTENNTLRFIINGRDLSDQECKVLRPIFLRTFPFDPMHVNMKNRVIYMVDGEMAATCRIRHIGLFTEVTHFYVLEQYRCMGIGEELLRYAICQGREYVILTVRSDNNPMLSLCRKLNLTFALEDKDRFVVITKGERTNEQDQQQANKQQADER